MSKRCPDCYQRTSTRGRCPNCRAEQVAEGVDHAADDARTCAWCGRSTTAGHYARTGRWLCTGCEREQLAAVTPDRLAGAVRWAVGGDDLDADPAESEAGFEAASHRLVADGGQIECCPYDDCGSAQIRSNSESMVGRTAEASYRCKDCGRAFDELDTRERGPVGRGRRGLAGKLADPDVSDPADLDGGEA